jgi:phosphoglycerate dehydrogenase-like enzyme
LLKRTVGSIFHKMIVLMDERMDGSEHQVFIKSLRSEFRDVQFITACTNEELETAIPSANVYYGMPWRTLIEKKRSLQWIHYPATGIDGFTFSDMKLEDTDIAVTNCRGPHASSMGDHTIGMMVTLAHQLNEVWADQENAHWDRTKYIGRQVEMTGKSLGLLAAGDIGMAVACRAHGFGMTIYAVDKNTEPREPYIPEVWGFERVDHLMEVSDWLVIAAPLTKETIGLITSQRINLMRKGSYIIVVSRGKIVDENALANALEEGHLAGAAVDAFAQEPLSKDSLLWKTKNLLITPHMSGSTSELTEGRFNIFRENLRRFKANKPFLYTPNLALGY